MGNLGSGFTGWRTPIGDIPNTFGALEHYVQAGGVTPPSLCRVRVFEEAAATLATLVADRYIAMRPDMALYVHRLELGAGLPVGRYYVQVNHDQQVGVMRNNPQTTWNMPTYAGYSNLTNTNLSVTSFNFPGGAQNSEYF